MANFWSVLTARDPVVAAAMDTLDEPKADSEDTGSHLAHVAFSDLFPSLATGIVVTRSRALSTSVVRKARKITCTQMSRMPMVINDSDGARSEDQPAWLTEMERGRPTSTTILWLTDQLIFYPFAHLLVTERYHSGKPARFQLVDRAKATYDSSGSHLIAYDDAPVDPADAIRFDSPDSGLLLEAADDIRRALVLTAAASQAEDNPVPVLNLANESNEQLTKDEVDELLESWQNARRRRAVSYTPPGIKLEQYGAKSEQLLIEGQRRLDIVLARHMNVPAWLMDAPIEGSSLNYSNRASRNWELIDLTLAPYMTAIADRLSLSDIIPAGKRVAFILDELVRDDRKTRYETYEIGIRNKIITAQEARLMEQIDAQTRSNRA